MSTLQCWIIGVLILLFLAYIGFNAAVGIFFFGLSLISLAEIGIDLGTLLLAPQHYCEVHACKVLPNTDHDWIMLFIEHNQALAVTAILLLLLAGVFLSCARTPPTTATSTAVTRGARNSINEHTPEHDGLVLPRGRLPAPTIINHYRGGDRVTINYFNDGGNSDDDNMGSDDSDYKGLEVEETDAE